MIPLKKIFLLYVFVMLSFTSFSQNTTYKVVCDKTDNKLKVVKAENHSSNFVPVKSGFPFAAIARDWIKDNYSTDDCDAEKLINDINNKSQSQTKTQAENPPVNQQQTGAAVTAPTPAYTPSKPNPVFKNTSFGFDLLFHNLDEIMQLDESKLGIGLNLEHIFGKKRYYIGTGAHFNVLVAEDNSETVELYMFKFPVFGGYRINSKRFYLAFEGGLFINTKLSPFKDDDTSLHGRLPLNSSYSIFPRLRFGGKSMQLEAGAEFWLSDVLENTDKLSVYHLAIRFLF